MTLQVSCARAGCTMCEGSIYVAATCKNDPLRIYVSKTHLLIFQKKDFSTPQGGTPIVNPLRLAYPLEHKEIPDQVAHVIDVKAAGLKIENIRKTILKSTHLDGGILRIPTTVA